MGILVALLLANLALLGVALTMYIQAGKAQRRAEELMIQARKEIEELQKLKQ